MRNEKQFEPARRRIERAFDGLKRQDMAYRHATWIKIKKVIVQAILILQEMQLVEDLYALEEPWRTRFLELIAKLATGQQWGNQTPSRNMTEAWLLENKQLRNQIAQMLKAWT